MDPDTLAAIEAAVMRAVLPAIDQAITELSKRHPRRSIPVVLLTFGEAAGVLACSMKHLRELIAAGTLRTKRIGKKREMVPLAEVIRLTAVGDDVTAPTPELRAAMLTYDEAARQLAVHRNTLKRMVGDGSIKAVKVGKHRPRIPSSEIARVVGAVNGKPKNKAPTFDAKAEAQAFSTYLKQKAKET